MGEFPVRRAEVSDAERIAEIQAAAWNSAYRGIMADDVLDGLDTHRIASNLAESLGNENNSISTLVATSADDGKVLGFGGTCVPRDGEEVLGRLQTTDGLGELAFLNVHPEAFGSGAASVLIRALEDDLRAQGFVRAYLMVAEGNDRAMRFYTKHGWQRSDITHAFANVSPPVPERLFHTSL
jgi:ribosomal protein S18 acetylase RimI-like enzyme